MYKPKIDTPKYCRIISRTCNQLFIYFKIIITMLSIKYEIYIKIKKIQTMIFFHNTTNDMPSMPL